MEFYTDHRGRVHPKPRYIEPDLRWVGVLSCIVSAAITIGAVWGIVYLAIEAMAQ